MKQKEIEKIVKERFESLENSSRKILKTFNAEDIHCFRVEVKKLRAFLRLINIKKEIKGPLIPKHLKAFYDCTGSIRNIQLHKQDLSKCISGNRIEKIKAYIKLLDEEKNCWEKKAREIMDNKKLNNIKRKILKKLPGGFKKSSVKDFEANKLSDLKNQLKNLNNDDSFHTARKILKDILYTWNYLKDHIHLPKTVSHKKELKKLTAKLGDFMDISVQLQLLQPGYLDKIKDEKEKALLNEIKDRYLREKNLMAKRLRSNLNTFLKYL